MTDILDPMALGHVYRLPDESFGGNPSAAHGADSRAYLQTGEGQVTEIIDDGQTIEFVVQDKPTEVEFVADAVRQAQEAVDNYEPNNPRYGGDDPRL